MKHLHKILLLPAIVLSFSCTSYKELIYLQELARETRDTVISREKPHYRLQRGDILYVRVVTNNQEIDRLFNLSPAIGTGVNQNYIQQQMTYGGMGMGLYYQGYAVDDSGYIDLPVIHKIQVLNKTMDEAKYEIVNDLHNFLEDAVVIVRLENFKLTFLGEVQSPGVQTLNLNKINIMEALGYVGGINRNGNRKDIMVIRSLDDGSRVYRLDLTDKRLIEQPEFDLLPNDVIYVPPLRTSWFKDETTTFTFWLTTVSTTITTTALIISLLNKN